MTTAIDALRQELAAACRIMAHRGLVEDILGHISVRHGDHLLVRCRGLAEAGLRFTSPQDIRLVELESGLIVDDPDGAFSTPSELPIHTEVLRARADVGAVVHAHPPDVVVASLADIELTPIFGAYDIPATRLAAAGIPVDPRSVLMTRSDLAAGMVHSLGDSQVLVLRGHGVVTVGATVREAVLRALQVDTLARMHLGVRRAGVEPSPLTADDLAELPDLGSGFNHDTLWRHHLTALSADGRYLDNDNEETK